ncbi:hypothetical protein BaRGS_00003399 [Batillaria attramentaria]|uniref:Uncharacterized protein n=1 Tax=Batillaria attramentaria TaxID=370345 RepID=A0ABD0M0S9_9CAEN
MTVTSNCRLLSWKSRKWLTVDIPHWTRLKGRLLYCVKIVLTDFFGKSVQFKPPAVNGCAVSHTVGNPACNRPPTENISAPTENITAPTENITAPTENISAPTENISAPTENISAPTENISAPTENISAPTENITAPTENITAPTENISAPTENTTALHYKRKQ